MTGKTLNFEFGGETFVIADHLNSRFITISDIIVFSNRSRRSIMEFCKTKNIPIFILKENNKTRYEFVDFELFQTKLFEDAKISTKTVKQKKLPSMSTALYYSGRKRALDYLKTSNFEKYADKHLRGPEKFYRCLGLYIECMKYKNVNVLKTESDENYDLSKLKTGDVVLRQIDERLINLVNYIKIHISEDKSTAIKKALNDAKWIPNEKFFSETELNSNKDLQDLLTTIFKEKK